MALLLSQQVGSPPGGATGPWRSLLGVGLSIIFVVLGAIMKRWSQAVVIVVLLLAGVASGEELLTARVMSTSTLVCPYDQTLIWTSPLLVPIRVKRIVIWHGFSRDAQADLATVVYQGPPENSVLMSSFLQDRYANPSGPTSWAADFAPDWITVPAQGIVRSRAICYNSTPTGKNGNHVVDIWYTVP